MPKESLEYYLNAIEQTRQRMRVINADLSKMLNAHSQEHDHLEQLKEQLKEEYPDAGTP
jgi:hypothetical protein